MTDESKVVVAASSAQRDPIIKALKQAGLDCELICQPQDSSDAPLCRWLAPEQLNERSRVRFALEDAIDTLEQTRHAFRSRQLAGLRHRLEGLLQSLSEDDL